jgi:hypothetical protein
MTKAGTPNFFGVVRALALALAAAFAASLSRFLVARMNVASGTP